VFAIADRHEQNYLNLKLSHLEWRGAIQYKMDSPFEQNYCLNVLLNCKHIEIVYKFCKYSLC